MCKLIDRTGRMQLIQAWKLSNDSSPTTFLSLKILTIPDISTIYSSMKLSHAGDAEELMPSMLLSITKDAKDFTGKE